jgi:creatinine amidohydrolase/Fe(II)-dependent formamide hydrolase-like protein
MDPRDATPEKGKKIFEDMVRMYADLAETALKRKGS